MWYNKSLLLNWVWNEKKNLRNTILLIRSLRIKDLLQIIKKLHKKRFLLQTKYKRKV